MGITSNHFYERQIKFSNEMVVVPGRVLDPPTLKYGSRTEKPQRGSWNLVGKQFSMGVSIDTWAVLWIKTAGTRTPPDQVQGAVDTFKKKLGEMGMRVGQRVGLDAIDVKGSIDEQNHIIEGTLQRLAQKKVSLLLIILPVGGDRIFRHVKWRADCEYGIPNHCVLVDKFAKGNPQYMANNGLKVNLKLHGINHILDTSASGILAAGKTMVVGIDATHPSPTDCENFPTIAAVVASTDGRLGQWPGDISLQTSKREILDKMTELMDGRLRHWAKINKSLPANIIVYRDGVSEGQYAEVVRDELASIRRSIKNQYKSAPPKITFIVVTKRHHVRFFPTNAEGCDDKSNCKNGTIVDRGITRPWQWDFYLQAQAPLQGSARPAHYVVLHDEIFSPSSRTAADDIQQLTHNICYMMARCTRSISYATPAFLADRLCDRARRYVLACYEDKQQKNPKVKRSNLRPTQKEVSINSRLADTMVYI